MFVITLQFYVTVLMRQNHQNAPSVTHSGFCIPAWNATFTLVKLWIHHMLFLKVDSCFSEIAQDHKSALYLDRYEHTVSHLDFSQLHEKYFWYSMRGCLEEEMIVFVAVVDEVLGPLSKGSNTSI